MQLHCDLSGGRSADGARGTGQVRAGAPASGDRQLFLLLDCVSLQPCGGVQRTPVAQQYVFGASERRDHEQQSRGEEVECRNTHRCLAHRRGAAQHRGNSTVPIRNGEDRGQYSPRRDDPGKAAPLRQCQTSPGHTVLFYVVTCALETSCTLHTSNCPM